MTSEPVAKVKHGGAPRQFLSVMRYMNSNVMLTMLEAGYRITVLKQQSSTVNLTLRVTNEAFENYRELFECLFAYSDRRPNANYQMPISTTTKDFYRSTLEDSL